MHPSPVPPRRVRIGAAAAFVGTTPRAIRHYHDTGLLPEPERGADDRRRYGYDDVIRLLWIRRMADAGIALDDVGRAVARTDGGADAEEDLDGVLERLDRTLAEREAELKRQRAAVGRMRTRGSRVGLLADVVAARLEGLPSGSLRPADLDALLVTERIFGPLGAAVQASRFIALARDAELRAESDRVDAAEEALDETVAVDDDRVARVAADRHAFEMRLHSVVEDSGLGRDEEVLLDAWDEDDPAPADADGRRVMSAAEAVGLLPYDLSPARLRCLELADELAADEMRGPRVPSTGTTRSAPLETTERNAARMGRPTAGPGDDRWTGPLGGPGTGRGGDLVRTEAVDCCGPRVGR